ncbi:MAG: histidine phosphatase family protein [Planctomycetes bacterium]|nr:histidine phosphatase family protein [Planctomycetota bacterium]
MRLGNVYLGQRHGESQANARGIIISDPARGVPGFGLTARGREQARAEVLGCPLLGPRAVIVSSDFLRARETAEVARAALGAGPVRLSAALRERWFGAHEGGSNAAYERVWARDREDPTHTDDGVEAAKAVRDRAWALVEALEAELRGETVLLVAHGDPLQLLQTAFLDRGAGEHRDLPPWAPGEVRAF